MTVFAFCIQATKDQTVKRLGPVTTYATSKNLPLKETLRMFLKSVDQEEEEGSLP